MIRQLIICLVILVAAGTGAYFYVPGVQQSLADLGIALPAGPDAVPAEGARPGPGGQAGNRPDGGQQAARPGGGGGPGARPGGGAGRAANVVTDAVVMASINDNLSAIGQGDAVRSVTVTSPSGGTLVELVVSPGDHVAAGAVIGRLDAASEEIALERAQLAATDAETTLERNQGLASSSLVTNSAVAALRLEAETAQLELRDAQMALDRRTITSPIAGIVGLMQVTPGNYVSAQSVVTTVDDTSSILIDFWVPERYAASVRNGMEVSATAVAMPGQRFDGKVTAVDNRIDPESRTLQLEAEIPNDADLMRSGMSFLVALKFPGETFPAVNPLSIQWSAEGSYVWQYVDGKAKKVFAEIVQRNSDGVLVRGPLQPGDAIITEGVLQLSDGMAVNLLEGPTGAPVAELPSDAGAGVPAAL